MCDMYPDDQLSTYALGLLDSNVTDELSAHLKKCDSCQNRLEELEHLLDAVQQTEAKRDVKVGPNFTAMIMQEISKDHSGVAASNVESSDRMGVINEATASGWQRRTWLSLAACVAVVCTGYVMGLFKTVDQPVALGTLARFAAPASVERDGKVLEAQVGMEIFESDIVRMGAGAGGSVKYAKEDTLVVLDADSSARFSQLDGSKRIELQSGTMTFRVAPQPVGHPLVVATYNAEVEVVGTMFSVRVDKARTHLEVRSGKVKFKDLAGGKALAVVAGQDARVGQDGIFSSKLDLENPPEAKVVRSINLKEHLGHSIGTCFDGIDLWYVRADGSLSKVEAASGGIREAAIPELKGKRTKGAALVDGKLWVVNKGGSLGEFWVFNTSTGKKVKSFRLRENLSDITFGAGFVWGLRESTARDSDGTVKVFGYDCRTGAKVKEFTILPKEDRWGANRRGIAFSEGKLWVRGTSENDILGLSCEDGKVVSWLTFNGGYGQYLTYGGPGRIWMIDSKGTALWIDIRGKKIAPATPAPEATKLPKSE